MFWGFVGFFFSFFSPQTVFVVWSQFQSCVFEITQLK